MSESVTSKAACPKCGAEAERETASMRYDQVDTALGFLREPDSSIILQTGFLRDLDLVRKYVREKLGDPHWERIVDDALSLWTYDGNRRITFEAVEVWNVENQMRPIFLIERLDGKLPKGVAV